MLILHLSHGNIAVHVLSFNDIRNISSKTAVCLKHANNILVLKLFSYSIKGYWLRRTLCFSVVKKLEKIEKQF